MGDLLRALGDGKAARRFYEQALSTRQQLVQREPDCADLQWDLVCSLLRIAEVDASHRTEHLSHALALLRPLHAAGRLFPEQAKGIAIIEEQLKDSQSDVR